MSLEEESYFEGGLGVGMNGNRRDHVEGGIKGKSTRRDDCKRGTFGVR